MVKGPLCPLQHSPTAIATLWRGVGHIPSSAPLLSLAGSSLSSSLSWDSASSRKPSFPHSTLHWMPPAPCPHYPGLASLIARIPKYCPCLSIHPASLLGFQLEGGDPITRAQHRGLQLTWRGCLVNAARCVQGEHKLGRELFTDEGRTSKEGVKAGRKIQAPGSGAGVAWPHEACLCLFSPMSFLRGACPPRCTCSLCCLAARRCARPVRACVEAYQLDLCVPEPE